MKSTSKILLAVALVALPCVVSSASIIDDFSGGVVAVNHPDPANGGSAEFGVYYDLKNDTFGTPSDGGGFLRIDDGGFTNGVYVIYEAVIPADGIYNISADVNVEATATSGLSAYQMGAVVNGVHRGENPSAIAPLVAANSDTGIGGITFDAGTDPAATVLTTGSFMALAGDNLLIAFGSDLETVDFNANSGFWNQSFVTVDNISLNVVPEPTGFVLFAITGLMLVVRRRR